MVMLSTCSIANDSNMKKFIEQKYVNELHADKDNLLAWVMKSKSISAVYYSIPSQYRK